MRLVDKNNFLRYRINVMVEAMIFPATFRRTIKSPWPRKRKPGGYMALFVEASKKSTA
jgi:hypothetical protein